MVSVSNCEIKILTSNFLISDDSNVHDSTRLYMTVMNKEEFW